MDSPAKKQDIPAPRRAQILAAATELFSRRGYHGVTVDAIAQRAGISKGNLYWYFKSKQEIFQALFTEVVQRMEKPVLEIMESDRTPREKLRALVRTNLDNAEANPDDVYLVWQMQAQPELQELVSSEYRLWMGPFADHVIALFAAIGVKSSESAGTLFAITLNALPLLVVVYPDIHNKEKLMTEFEESIRSLGEESDVQSSISGGT